MLVLIMAYLLLKVYSTMLKLKIINSSVSPGELTPKRQMLNIDFTKS